MATLLDLLLSQHPIDWDIVTQRIESRPNEVAELDADGLSVLHIACSDYLLDSLPLRVLELMLKKDRIRFDEGRQEKLAACRLSHNGETPLHTCIDSAGIQDLENKAMAAVELFIRYAPECFLLVSNWGESCLHMAVMMRRWRFPTFDDGDDRSREHDDQMRLKICKLLVEAEPELLFVRHSKENLTPLQMALKHGYIYGANVKYEQFETLMPRRTMTSASGNLLHRFAAFNLTDEVQWKQLLKWLPMLRSRLTEQDEDGNTPLHVALVCNRYHMARIIANTNSVLMNIPNKKGQFPLELLWNRTSGDGGGVREAVIHLVDVCPVALKRMPLYDVLYPSILCAVRTETIYELLKLTPSLVVRTRTSADDLQEAHLKRRKTCQAEENADSMVLRREQPK